MNKYLLMSSAAALIVASGATATTFHGKNIPFHASAVTGSRATGHFKQTPYGHPGAPKCGTAFGATLPTPDGLIAWNDTTGAYNTAGGADFTCAAKTKVKKVWVKGYFGAVQEQFNVTFYKNSGADGSDEPNDNAVVCSYTGLIGTAGGQYPTDQLTKLTLSSPCKLKAGHYWVAVQNNDSAGPWYWEMTNDLGGSARGDWDDVTNVFGSGCTNFNNDRYLVDCLGYSYQDYMLELH